MREPRGLAAADERGQRRPVQGDMPVGRELVLDRRAGDLVAERDRVALGAQHPRGQARLELRKLVRQRSARAARSPRAAARRRRPRAAAARGGAGAPRGRARRRARCRACCAVAREHLGHEERVAAGARVERGAVDAVRCREAATASRDNGSTVIRCASRELAEHDAQRVVALELVVAVGRDHQRRHARHAPAEQVHEVERRLVGPVQVLEDDDRASRGRRAPERRAPRWRTRRVRSAPRARRRRRPRCRAAGRAGAA